MRGASLKMSRRVRLASPSCYACGTDTEDTEDFPRYGTIGCALTCCRECQKLGGNKFEDSILDRARFIQGRLRTKYKSHLNSPDWSEEEIGELSGNLPGEIRRFGAVSARARQRLAWNVERHLGQLDLANDPHEVAASLGIDPADPPYWWRSLFPGY